jgi:YebC/PmpR family DNA-binding regulatory protein
MSGHSKWSTIKRQKGAADAKRGQMFTKLSREIELAARTGDPDPEMNFRLRLTVQKARDHNMPVENIERAIKRAAGGAEGIHLVEATYEGYGPGGTAILIETLTDNKNRTTAEIRSILARSNTNLGDSGCVTWIFQPKGVITISASAGDTEKLELQAIDAGAEDVKEEGGVLEIQTEPEALEKVKKALEEQGIKIASAELTRVPQNIIALDEKTAIPALKLMDRLEELDDVQRVFINADFPDKALETYRSQG